LAIYQCDASSKTIFSDIIDKTYTSVTGTDHDDVLHFLIKQP